MDLDKLLEKYQVELDTLVFDDFTNETALKIGLHIIEVAKKNNNKITIDINRFNHQIFHYSFENTTPDKDLWVSRKRNVVEHFFVSSIYMATKLKKDNTNLWDKYGLSPAQYAAVGGSFPIIVKNIGVIGSITVSGLKPEEDHDLVVTSIRNYLNTAY